MQMSHASPSNPRELDSSVSIADAVALLAPELGEELALHDHRAIPGARDRLWGDVIVEQWLTPPHGRLDVMGALIDPDHITEERRGRLSWLEGPLIEAWTQDHDPLPSPVLWFEWDAPGTGPRAPLVSVCLSDEVLGDVAKRRAPTERSEWLRLLDRCIELFDGRAESRALHGVVDALPPNGSLLHIATLASRGLRGLRVVCWVPANGLLAWLEALDWPGPREALRSLLFASAAPFGNVGVQLEVLGGALGPYIGIETQEYFQHPGKHQLHAWIDSLEALGAPTDAALLYQRAARITTGQPVADAHPDRLYLKGAFDGQRWHGKSYMAYGMTG